jgi:hypothetical protein
MPTIQWEWPGRRGEKEAVDGLGRTDSWNHMSSIPIAIEQPGSLDRKNE